MNRLFRSRLSVVGVLVALAATALMGCGREADPVPTLAAPAAPVTTTELVAPPTPPITPVATSTPAPTPTTAAAAATDGACAFAVQPRFASIWSVDELGCPLDAGLDLINTAYAPFEGGQMLWRSDTAMIYVLTHDNRWSGYPDEWKEGDPVYICGEENSPPTPVRGFGRVWCLEPGVRDALGAVTAYEIGASDSDVQDFERGTILQAPWGSIFVFAGDQWRRVEPVE